MQTRLATRRSLKQQQQQEKNLFDSNKNGGRNEVGDDDDNKDDDEEREIERKSDSSSLQFDSLSSHELYEPSRSEIVFTSDDDRETNSSDDSLTISRIIVKHTQHSIFTHNRSPEVSKMPVLGISLNEADDEQPTKPIKRRKLFSLDNRAHFTDSDLADNAENSSNTSKEVWSPALEFEIDLRRKETAALVFLPRRDFEKKKKSQRVKRSTMGNRKTASPFDLNVPFGQNEQPLARSTPTLGCSLF